jgi:hypothetical protein
MNNNKMKPSAALKLAYKRMSKASKIDQNPSQGVCYWMDYTLPPSLNSYINKALGNHAYAHRWLYFELFPENLTSCGLIKDKLHYYNWSETNELAIYQWRLRWIKQMITYFKSIGE